MLTVTTKPIFNFKSVSTQQITESKSETVFAFFVDSDCNSLDHDAPTSRHDGVQRVNMFPVILLKGDSTLETEEER